jgi:hypothetical protein
LRGSSAEPGTLLTTTGRYTLVGNTVYVSIGFENVTTTGYSGNISVDQLPFNCGATRAILSVSSYSGGVWTDQPIGALNYNTTTVSWQDAKSAAEPYAYRTVGTDRSNTMLEKVITEDKIEIVGEHRHCSSQNLYSKVMEDGVELSSGYHRHVISAGQDYSNESPEVQAICAAVHTPEVIAAYQASQETE